MEMLDVLDERGQPTGAVEERVRVHELGLWHHSAHVWIFGDDWVLLQKRALDKDTNAGLWYGAAAGHITAGQTPEEAAHRESLEELGVFLPADMRKLGIWTVIEDIPEKRWMNREFYHVYLCRHDERPTVSPQQSEVETVAFIPFDLFEQQVRDDRLSNYVPRPGYYAWVIEGMRRLLAARKV